MDEYQDISVSRKEPRLLDRVRDAIRRNLLPDLKEAKCFALGFSVLLGDRSCLTPLIFHLA